MNSQSTFTILDIGSGRIHCLIVQRGQNDELEVIGYSERNSMILNRGMINNIDNASKIIHEVVSRAEMMAGVEVNSCYVNVPGILCKGISSHGLVAVSSKNGEKEVHMDDLERVIEIAESTPIPHDHMIIHSIPINFKVDGQKVEDPQGSVGMRLEVDIYLLICPKLALDSIYKVVGKSGYEVIEVVAENFSCAEAVLSEEEKQLGSIVIDIGAEYTNVVQYCENSINMSFTVPLGSDSLTKDLSIGLSTSLAEAEEIKKRYGVLDHNMVDEDKVITVKLISYQKKTHVSQKAIYQIIEARMTEIFEMIKNEFNYQSKHTDMIGGVVVTGGGGNIPGIDVLGRNVFNQSVRIGYPIGVHGLDEEVANPAFATSFGIAKMMYHKNERTVSYSPFEEQSGVLKKITSSIKNFFT